MKTAFRSPLFWTLFTLLGIAGALFSKAQFSRAYPILDQPLEMSSEAATREAGTLAKAHGWSSSTGGRSATRLWHDADLTTFIELEAGGKENLGTLLQQGRISPYRWQVRLFKEKEAAETLVQFRPNGQLYSFEETLPDSQTGNELQENEARTFAEKQAASFGIDLSSYRLEESKNSHNTAGRLDHSFTYERANPLLGAGREQLVLTVRGDRFSGLTPKVKIPEDFYRRYQAMRASNTNLQLASTVAIALLLGLGCGALGLRYLLRRDAVNWRGALVMTGVLAAGGALAAVNVLPLSWFGYDTALTAGEFQTKTIFIALIQGAALFIFTPVLAAAEGLAREAFPRHPRLWKALSPRAAASREVGGAVIAGYGLCVLMFTYQIVMIRFGVSKLGWWTPSSALFDPGLLGAYAPWFAPLNTSLFAGLVEECLFRALPLACAVLLGRHYGRSWLWVGTAVILQAFIFGAAHSSYPTMPGWSRMVELLIPSVVFAGLFLRFGLLPGVMMHFLFDVLWMGIPLFADKAPGARLNQAIVCTLALSPLAWVLICRLRAGVWQELPDTLRNQGWVRPAKPEQAAAPVPVADERRARPTQLRKLFFAGMAALVVWAITMHRAEPSMPGLALRKEEAVLKAREFLANEGVKLGSDWEVLPLAHSDSQNERSFVLKTSGEAVFKNLTCNYLAVPGWRIRFLRSQLPLPDRAEEYHVFLTGDGRVQRYAHLLPETREGAQLPKAEAQVVAERELRRIYQLEPRDLTLVSARETKQPKRSDWLFIWKDPKAGLTQGEARIWILIAGDTLSKNERHVNIPDDWERAQASGENARGMATSAMGIISMCALLGGLILSIRNWRQNPVNWKAALVAGGVCALIFALQLLVKLPSHVAWFSTNESLQVQVTRSLVAGAVGIIIVSASMGYLGGLGTGRTATPGQGWMEWLAGLGAGCLLLLAERLIDLGAPKGNPWHAGIDGANTGIPLLSGLWISMALLMTSLCWVRVRSALAILGQVSWRRMTVLALLGLCYGGSLNGSSWFAITLSGLVYASGFVLLDRLVSRTHPSIIVAVLAAHSMGKAGGEFLIPGHPDSRIESLCGVLIATVVGGILFVILRNEKHTGKTEPAPECAVIDLPESVKPAATKQ